MQKKSAPPVSPPLSVVLLAAGVGKRMRSMLPKVLHEVGGRPLLFHILDQLRESAPGAAIAVVVGHGREKVEAAVKADASFAGMQITFVHQPEQKGTGHAARCAMDSHWGGKRMAEGSSVLVLPGDLPLLGADLLAAISAPLAKGEVMRLLTCELPDPAGYGRIVRKGASGPVQAIVEERDATERERRIREVGTSIYLFEGEFLKAGLGKLKDRNAQGELYLTDLVAAAAKARKKIGVLRWTCPEDVRGVNDPWELSLASRILNERCVRGWALQGVKFVDPDSTWVDCTVKFSGDARVHPGTVLRGRTEIGEGTEVGPHAVLSDVKIGKNVKIKTGTVAEASEVGDGAKIGPYAHLRPGSIVGAEAKIGNFVELKQTRIGEKTSVAHLSYLGDAEVGREVNIGCGFVTCNFDGRIIEGNRKHRTVIEDKAFIGSDCQAVAPVRIGKGAYVASGSTITENVEPESLAIARSRQVNKPGYARKLKKAEG